MLQNHLQSLLLSGQLLPVWPRCLPPWLAVPAGVGQCVPAARQISEPFQLPHRVNPFSLENVFIC